VASCTLSLGTVKLWADDGGYRRKQRSCAGEGPTGRSDCQQSLVLHNAFSHHDICLQPQTTTADYFVSNKLIMNIGWIRWTRREKFLCLAFRYDMGPAQRQLQATVTATNIRPDGQLFTFSPTHTTVEFWPGQRYFYLWSPKLSQITSQVAERIARTYSSCTTSKCNPVDCCISVVCCLGSGSICVHGTAAGTHHLFCTQGLTAV
jgi:hypothetical protein